MMKLSREGPRAAEKYDSIHRNHSSVQNALPVSGSPGGDPNVALGVIAAFLLSEGPSELVDKATTLVEEGSGLVRAVHEITAAFIPLVEAGFGWILFIPLMFFGVWLLTRGHRIHLSITIESSDR